MTNFPLMYDYREDVEVWDTETYIYFDELGECYYRFNKLSKAIADRAKTGCTDSSILLVKQVCSGEER